jgi:hypothetical protein
MKAKVSGLLVIVALMLTVLGCKTEKKATTRVYKINPADSEKIRGGVIYGLPKTQLTFKIKALRNVHIPGPYHEYGEQLLGLENIPHSKEIHWEIAGIRIKESTRIDYDHLYAVEPRGRFRFDWTKFTRNGWIIPFDGVHKEYEESDFYKGSDYEREILYKDLSVKKFVGKETKTVYRKVWKDSLFARVPRKETEVVKKNKQEKAREAANFIFMIREKRFELVSGMGDYYPEGEALKAAVDEMNRLEDNYLSLFTGKHKSDTLEFTIQWTPKNNDLAEPKMLFRFSENLGVLKADQNKGTPIWIETEAMENKQEIIKAIQSKFSATGSKLFHYRIPMNTSLKVKYGDQMMAKKYINIYQYGPIFKMPYKFLNDSRIIDYFPEKED